MATTDGLKTATAASRRTIASYSTYAEAERAVDWLSDHGFAVERSAIVGTGLRSVEQVTGRMTQGRAAKIGAAQGALIGALFGLLFGIFFTGPDFAKLLLFSLAVGGLFGAVYGALFQCAASGGKRDFVSASNIEADRYDVQVDEEGADEATGCSAGCRRHADLRTAGAFLIGVPVYRVQRRRMSSNMEEADGGHHRRAALQ